MPRFVNEIYIGGKVEEVFDFITTPSHWPRLWAPWSKRIEPFIDTPLSPADPSFIEYAKVMGLRHDFTWKSLVAERPRFFLMTGEFQHFGKAFAFIHYDLEQRGKQVRYRRTVLFSHHGFFMTLVDPILKRLYFRISKKALGNTKRIFEQDMGGPRPASGSAQLEHRT